jgi:predicted permease
MNEFRSAFRQLARSPSFAVFATATLALGIGATALLLAIIDGVLFAPLPYPQPEDIVRVLQLNERGIQSIRVADPNFADLDAQNRSLAAFAQFNSSVESVAGGSEPTRTSVANVSREFFTVLGARPQLGRAFADEELHLGAAPAVLISYGYWQRYLGGATDFASRTLRFNDRQYAIVGVMPRGFDYPEGADVWAPRELWPVGEVRSAHNFQAIGRLAPNVTIPQARAELGAIARQLKATYGDDTFMSDVAVVSLREQLTGVVRPALLVLAAGAALLFLVAWTNVVSMLLARTVAREAELAVRVALGAGRSRLTRQFFAECLIWSVAGALIGLVLAAFGVHLLAVLDPGTLPRVDAIRVSGLVVAAALALAVLVAGGSSVLVTRRLHAYADLAQASRRSTLGPRNTRLREGLVAGQVAIAVVLTIGALLLGRSFLLVANVDPGFKPAGVVFMNLAMAYPEQPEDGQRLMSVYERVMERLRALPGVDAVGGVTAPPLAGDGTNGMYVEQSSPGEIDDLDALRAAMADRSRWGFAEFRIASEEYFPTLGIPLLRGRLFARSDAASSPHVAVISQSLAATKWPSEDPLGKLLQFGGMDGDVTPFTVIGVVGDVRDYGLEAAARPTFYAYYRQRQRHLASFWIAMRGPAVESVIPAAREIVRAIDADIPPEFRSGDVLFSRTLAQRRFNLVGLAVFGGSALLLALAGIYGAMAFNVAQRNHEIGVRLALGATGRRVTTTVMLRSLAVAGFGVAAGVVIALGASRFISALLYGVSARDPRVYASAAAGLIIAAVVAAWGPAVRAARVDPMAALRR